MRILDKSKLPPGLAVNRVWVSTRESDNHAIAYVSERRRRIVGAALIIAGVMAIFVMLLLQVPPAAALIGVAVSALGAMYANGGRSGFYELEPDGQLGAYLGRGRPELSSMRGMRP
jgi:hypothetical protein